MVIKVPPFRRPLRGVDLEDKRFIDHHLDRLDATGVSRRKSPRLRDRVIGGTHFFIRGLSALRIAWVVGH